MTTQANYDFLIVGGGIIGLTASLELRRRHPAGRIAVLEKEESLGMHASGRNSGVLHCGIYYTQDTLKAKMCSNGAKRIMQFADENGVQYRKSGKVIVPTNEQELPGLDRLMKNAKDNGIRAELLTADEIRKIEPHSRPYKKGIYCPDTAVIDSHGVLDSLADKMRQERVELKLLSPVLDVTPSKKIVRTPDGDISYGLFINCAGAAADKLARKFGLAGDYTLVPFKGLYYRLNPEKNHLVKSNIYPVPNLALPFLGVHLTRVVNGDVYAGPTAIPALGRENYGVLEGLRIEELPGILGRLASLYVMNHHNFRGLVEAEVKKYFKPNFLKTVQQLVPEVQAEDLLPSEKVGIRPQLVNIKKKRLELDYIIEKTDSSIHVLNAISPAFTCSLAFAEWLVDQWEGKSPSPDLRPPSPASRAREDQPRS